MGKIIDLTAPLGPGVSIPTGHPPVVYTPIHEHETHHRTNASISFSIHVGTHIDPPYHFVEDGMTIDEVPLERLMGTAYVIRLKGKIESGGAVTIQHLLDEGLTKEMLNDCFILINSGWSEEMFGRDDYYDTAGSNYLSTELAEWFVEAGIKAVALDHPPDAPGMNLSFDGTEAPVHRKLLGNNICIIENLINLEAITQDKVSFYAIPIKIAKGCGGPARVFVVENEGSI